MRRREFIGVLGGAVAWPLATQAQQHVPLIGFLSTNVSDLVLPRFVPAFVRGLSQGGFIDGQNVTIEYRWANNQNNRLPVLAGELVRGPVDVFRRCIEERWRSRGT
jgi:putative ABC transport system substrate-binding protein